MGFSSQDSNASLSHCIADLKRNSCIMTAGELGEYDAIATIRMIVSMLSVLGAVSIIASAVGRRQVRSPKVHPIFVLSLADFLLALLWVAGGIMWLRRIPDRVWCFAVSLPTVILECVTVNLTLVYALLAHSSLKQKNFGNILIGLRKSEGQVWHPCKTGIAYLIAWCFPMVFLMIVFGIIAAVTNIVSDASDCSCFCMPVFGNVLPYAIPRDWPTALYIHNMRKLLATYGMVVGTNYLVVFVLLVVIYRKILKNIRKIRVKYAHNREPNYGATQTLLVQGQSKARKRIIYFIAVFIVNGLFNFVLSYSNSVYQFSQLADESEDLITREDVAEFRSSWFFPFYIGVYILQSTTVPLQGFLNAIVYGWTREDFLYIMAMTSKDQEVEGELEYSGVASEVEKCKEDSGIHASIKEDEHPFTHTIFVTSESASDENYNSH